MNRKVMIGAVVALGAAACAAACAKSGTCQSEDASEPKPTVWDKLRQGMEELPQDAPPRILFDNSEATKANTDEILSLLKKEALTTTPPQ